MKDKHLDENDLLSIYYSEESGGALSEHLERCNTCKDEYLRMVKGIDKISEDVYSDKIRGIDDDLFVRQRNKILARLKEKDALAGIRLLPRFVPFAAILLVLLLMFSIALISKFRDGGTYQNGTKIVVMDEQDLMDDILLMEIEELKSLPDIEGLEIFVGLDDEGEPEEIEEHGRLNNKKTFKA